MNLLRTLSAYGGQGANLTGIIIFIIGLIILVLLIILIIVVTIYIFRRIEPQKQAGYDENALNITKRRFAAGEISKKEFEELKKEVGK